jgi:hypothetical protein
LDRGHRAFRPLVLRAQKLNECKHKVEALSSRQLLCASFAVHQAGSAASVGIDQIAQKPFHMLSRTLR